MNTLFTDEWYSQEKMKERGVVQILLCFLAKSLEICPCAMLRTFARGGRMPEGAQA